MLEAINITSKRTQSPIHQRYVQTNRTTHTPRNKPELMRKYLTMNFKEDSLTFGRKHNQQTAS